VEDLQRVKPALAQLEMGPLEALEGMPLALLQLVGLELQLEISVSELPYLEIRLGVLVLPRLEISVSELPHLEIRVLVLPRLEMLLVRQ
jgi:hypothetical protein